MTEATLLSRIETQQRRSIAAAVRAINTEARTVELSFSSEMAYPRYWGNEILDHSPMSVDLTRLNTGGAVLVDHDPADQVGVVERAYIGADRKGPSFLLWAPRRAGHPPGTWYPEERRRSYVGSHGSAAAGYRVGVRCGYPFGGRERDRPLDGRKEEGYP